MKFNSYSYKVEVYGIREKTFKKDLDGDYSIDVGETCNLELDFQEYDICDIFNHVRKGTVRNGKDTIKLNEFLLIHSFLDEYGTEWLYDYFCYRLLVFENDGWHEFGRYYHDGEKVLE